MTGVRLPRSFKQRRQPPACSRSATTMFIPGLDGAFATVMVSVCPAPHRVYNNNPAHPGMTLGFCVQTSSVVVVARPPTGGVGWAAQNFAASAELVMDTAPLYCYFCYFMAAGVGVPVRLPPSLLAVARSQRAEQCQAEGAVQRRCRRPNS